MCQENKDSSELADGFKHWVFLGNTRNTCIPGHSIKDTTLDQETNVNQKDLQYSTTEYKVFFFP